MVAQGAMGFMTSEVIARMTRHREDSRLFPPQPKDTAMTTSLPSLNPGISPSPAPATVRTLAAWRHMFASGDFSAVGSLLHPEVLLHSPLDDQPLHGAGAVGGVLGLAFSLYDRFAYGDCLWSEDGRQLALAFEGQMGPHTVRGVDRLQLDGQGRITTLEVFVRPLPALAHLAAEVQRRMAPQAGH
ncbi:NADH:flavin oxidoreductase/NADH oxidase [Acidovorax sp. Root267]|nr:NADH:flavin oxidoreductase/NADH oxidase [Acidovorax sp. Root267]